MAFAKNLNLLEIAQAVFAIALFIGFLRLINRKLIYFRKHGIPGIAKIVKMSATNIKHGERPLMEIILEVKEEGSDALRQVEIRQAFSVSYMPNVGDLVNILIDPKNKKKMIIDERNPQAVKESKF
ncbi:MAG: hypothetical protein AAGC65_16290 [Mucilaginibacter sp.]|uniref:hypothetical protein n=1 Tax=Mucilaginibacter sp. TaxID=1882438 RepID=UPI0031A0EE9B